MRRNRSSARSMGRLAGEQPQDDLRSLDRDLAAGSKAAARPPHSTLRRDWGGWSGVGHYACGAWRQGDPEDQVGDETCACEEYGQEPNDTDDGGIEVEIIGEACGYSGDFLIGGGTYETLSAPVFRGVYTGRAGYGLPGAAVVAKIRTIRNLSLTICADHGFTSTGRYSVRLLVIRMGQAKHILLRRARFCQ